MLKNPHFRLQYKAPGDDEAAKPEHDRRAPKARAAGDAGQRGKGGAGLAVPLDGQECSVEWSPRATVAPQVRDVGAARRRGSAAGAAHGANQASDCTAVSGPYGWTGCWWWVRNVPGTTCTRVVVEYATCIYSSKDER